VRFSEAQFPPEFLERFIPWEEGQYYSPDALVGFQQRLVDADYFAAVSVQPDLEHTEGIEVPINVDLSPAKRSIYTAGVYMSTDTGPGVKLGMQRRWVNRKGHKFQTDLDFAQRLSALSTSYRIPLPGPNEKSLNFGITHREEDTDTSQSRNDRLAVNETRQWHGFTRTVGMQYLAGTFEIAEEDRYSRLLYAEATLTRKQADDFFFPRRGWSVGTGLRFAPEGLLSDTSFSQVTLDGRYIMPAGRRQRLLARLSLGAMAVDDFNQLPPELRFFAGGDRSIRGFDYQQLGTTNSAGLVIGGEYLAVGSIELEHYFLPKWGAAVFVDGGDAFRTKEFDLNLGAGLGVRWRSPVGVVRVDFAKPISSDLADSIRFHVSIGPDL
jgi:translocation and assembly module TamA